MSDENENHDNRSYTPPLNERVRAQMDNDRANAQNNDGNYAQCTVKMPADLRGPQMYDVKKLVEELREGKRKPLEMWKYSSLDVCGPIQPGREEERAMMILTLDGTVGRLARQYEIEVAQRNAASLAQ
ncbi:hypothetical protein QAD02_008429 [Eretmocerus hayati]|uniref:Uncharacterized protein n=1 Tax=Eretmocerus hayati TaxID=131215 RepID=A0ACC2N6H7_9HYME|nr:hypothetical protein QAD02_008429 [Eretmocerus hayati]